MELKHDLELAFMTQPELTRYLAELWDAIKQLTPSGGPQWGVSIAPYLTAQHEARRYCAHDFVRTPVSEYGYLQRCPCCRVYVDAKGESHVPF